MRRDLTELGSVEHDVLVIGGGIQGACIAWDGALRGLQVALVARDDFGALLALTHLLSPTPSRRLHPNRRIAAGCVLPRPECLRLFPGGQPCRGGRIRGRALDRGLGRPCRKSGEAVPGTRGIPWRSTAGRGLGQSKSGAGFHGPCAACRPSRSPLVGAKLPPGDWPPLALRIQHAAREEMAVTLNDVVYRRTELGDPPGPDRESVGLATRIMGDALGWDERRRAAEEVSLLRAGSV